MVTNMYRTVRFTLERQEFSRRIVHVVRDPVAEVNVKSPVGKVLLKARAGDVVTAKAPVGDVVVKVLEVH